MSRVRQRLRAMIIRHLRNIRRWQRATHVVLLLLLLLLDLLHLLDLVALWDLLLHLLDTLLLLLLQRIERAHTWQREGTVRAGWRLAIWFADLWLLRLRWWVCVLVVIRI